MLYYFLYKGLAKMLSRVAVHHELSGVKLLFRCSE